MQRFKVYINGWGTTTLYRSVFTVDAISAEDAVNAALAANPCCSIEKVEAYGETGTHVEMHSMQALDSAFALDGVPFTDGETPSAGRATAY